MKKVIVLGATGGIGRLVIQQLNHSKEIKQTAFVRNSVKLIPEQSKDITVIEGDILDTNKLEIALQGQGVLIAAVSGDIFGQAKSIVKALITSGVSRIIWVTGLGIHHEVPRTVGEMLNYYVNKYPEYVHAADTIMNSGITYTLVRAAHLRDGSNMSYYLQKEGEDIYIEVVDRCAVAKFIVDMILDSDGLGENESLGITN